MSQLNRTGKNTEGNTLHITLIRSKFGAKPKTRGTLRALGLTKIGDTNVLPDRPEIRGMLARVPHLITLKDLSQESSS
jgi:large subunit ribosomal protein L30